MTKAESRELLVGLDIGTQSIRVLVAKALEGDGAFEIVGMGDIESQGIRRGYVNDVMAAGEAIRAAVAEATATSQVEIETVYVSIGGGGIASMNVWGLTPVAGDDVRVSDIEAALDNARSSAHSKIGEKDSIVHFITQEYVVDGIGGISNPLGMIASELGVKAHVVKASKMAVETLLRCVQRCGLVIGGVSLAPIAAASTALKPEERELGVVFVDIGEGTTGIAVYRGGVVRHSAVLPVGGREVTTDLMAGLRIGKEEAESLKIRYGRANRELDGKDRGKDGDKDAMAEISAGPGEDPARKRLVRTSEIAEFITPRIEELIGFVDGSLTKAGISKADCPSGVVLSGGLARMPGVIGLASDILGMQARLGLSVYEGANASLLQDRPDLVTAVGLVAQARSERKPSETAGRATFFKRIASWAKDWLSNTF